MAQDVIVRGVTYTGVEKLNLPISGGSALFRDTSDGDAVAGDVLSGKKAFNASGEINGSMPNQGAASGTISDKDTPYQIPQGYHDGNGSVDIASAQKALLIPGNIRSGVSVLGVTGDYAGGGGASTLLDIDFTRAIDTFTINNVNISPSGATFNTAAANFSVPFCGQGRTIEVDVISMNMTGTANKRFILTGAASSSNGFIWRHANLEWGLYNGSWYMSGITDMNYFDGSTVKITIDSSNKWHVYKDGVIVFEPTGSLAATSGLWSVGGSSNSCVGAVISAVRVY